MIGGVDWFGVDPLAAGPLVVWLVSCLVAGLVTGALLVVLGAGFRRGGS